MDRERSRERRISVFVLLVVPLYWAVGRSSVCRRRFSISCHQPAALFPVKSSVDFQDTAALVEVRPHEAADFTQAKAGGEFGVKEVVPDGYIPLDDGIVDMDAVVGFTASEDGLQLYFEDGSGYWLER